MMRLSVRKTLRLCTELSSTTVPHLSVLYSLFSIVSSAVAFSSMSQQVPKSMTPDSSLRSSHPSFAFTTWNSTTQSILQRYPQQIILPLSPDSHKGSSGGRLAVLGGSADYTGAPYYSGMAALQTGADLVYIWTAQEATLPIKLYSPELMVSAVYSTKEFEAAASRVKESDITWTDEMEDLVNHMASKVIRLCRERRLHALVIGPGMGRDEMVLEAIKRIVCELQFRVPLVLDADALFMLSVNDNFKRVFARERTDGLKRKVILTPNVMEYKRLFGEQPDVKSMAWAKDLVIIEKGATDIIWQGDIYLKCDEEGGLKRSGGIGDILSGCTGTLLGWQTLIDVQQQNDAETCFTDSEEAPNAVSRLALVGWTATCFVRRATRLAFDAKRRAMTAPDILNVLGTAIDDMTREQGD